MYVFIGARVCVCVSESDANNLNCYDSWILISITHSIYDE